MLAVVKMPHTEISINGEGTTRIIEYLKKEFSVEVLFEQDSDDELVNVTESDYWKENVTPGSLLMGYRLKHDLTQQDLAERSQISQVMISDYETGKRKLTQKAAMKFGNALNENPKKFFPSIICL